ncbi:MAG: VCBS repeat-containing protein [Planctomycetes bacterium]|nr:VCBS repeat-containing protein [Planctomycetota bacterium]
MRPVVPCVLVLATAAATQQVQFQPDTQRVGASCIPDQYGRTWLTIADADNDGDADVIGTGGQIAMLHTRGAGSWSTTNFAAAGGIAALADFDLDGDQDVLIVPPSPLTPALPALWARQGNAFTATPLPAAMNAVPVQGALLDDVDGDGDVDVLLAHAGGGPVAFQLWRNTGALTFTLDPAGVPANLPFSCWPSWLDFDRDGDRDVIASSPGAGTVLLRNQGGVFVDARSALPTMRIGHADLRVGDFDRDGRDDAVLSWWNGDLDALWGTATGGFTFQPALAPALSAQQVVPADLDADGDPDLLVIRGSNLGLIRNPGNRTLPAVTTLVPAFFGLGVGDLDGDGAADLIFGDVATSRLQCWLRASPETADVALFQGIRSPVRYDQGEHAPVAGDVDGDGRTDILLPSTVGLVVQHALGFGRWRSTITAPAAAPGAIEHYRLADLDGDGDLDLVVASGSSVRVLTNDGSGDFDPAALATEPGGPADGLRLADLDGDENVDLVRINSSGVLWNRNLGGGQFGPNVVLLPDATAVQGTLDVGDFDGDGDNDVLTTVATTGSDRAILVNDGSGNFAVSPTMRWTSTDTPYYMAVADLDGDGDLDLVEHRWELRLHRNLGAGVFADATAGNLPPSLAPNSIPQLQDLDGDGDRDLFCAVGINQPFGLLLVNDGTGRFTDVTGSRWRPQLDRFTGVPDCTLHDIDHDGDLDVLMGTSRILNIQPSQHIVLNHQRQLSSRQVPRPGGSFELDSFVLPGFAPPGFALLLASFGSQSPLTLPGIDGGLQLQGTLFTVGGVVTTPVGVFRTSVPIPPSLQFLGARLFWQQLAVPQNGRPGFSNAVEEVVIW